MPPLKGKILVKTMTFWDRSPIGSSFAKSPIGSENWFEEIRKEKDKTQAWRYSIFPEFLGKSVLEIGVGSGIDHKNIMKYGYNVYGVDESERCLELTKTFTGNRFLFRCKAESLKPFLSNYFDVVYSFGVFHHIPDVERAVAEVYRVLKPGGTAYIIVYHKFSLFYAKIVLMRMLRLEFLRESYAARLSRIEQGDGEVFVSVWSKRYARKLFKDFKVKIWKPSPLNWFMVIEATK